MFTPTEQRIMDVLADGYPHHREDLRLAIDEQASLASLAVHIQHIRQKLRPHGQDVITEVPNGRTIHYRHVRLLASAYNGYR